MHELRPLIENYWINKSVDKELYSKTKRASSRFRRFVTEQLGWRLIINERILKVEKIPTRAETFMGIQAFTEIRDYCIFCAILMYLEDKEDEEQFLLTDLSTAIELELKKYMEVDWTQFTQRKSLVRVVEFAKKMGLLIEYEKRSDAMSDGLGQEALYENTGLSRYFATVFQHDIAHFTSYQDFEAMDLQEVEMDRGHFRINRVYRQLVASPAMYWRDSDDQDAIYLKNQRQWVQKYAAEHIGGCLHIHKNAAFFVMEEGECFGEKHPSDSMISEIILMLCTEIRSQVNEGILAKNHHDCIEMSERRLEKLVMYGKEKYGSAWSKEYRDMTAEKLVKAMIKYMECWKMLQRKEDGMILLPAIGKLVGRYPKDFMVKEAMADDDALANA